MARRGTSAAAALVAIGVLVAAAAGPTGGAGVGDPGTSPRVAAGAVGAGAVSPTCRSIRAGRSVRRRPIVAVACGDPRARTRVLVVGSIHGNETAGHAVVRQLRRLAVPAGVQLWTLRTANPDGVARGTRQNAHGVDLNRNFPYRWRRQGGRFSPFYSGPSPLSEPESRAVRRLVRWISPHMTIWYHQALRLVDLGSGGDPAIVRAYARRVGLPARTIGFLPGVATRWQNRRFPKTSAFAVELPGGRLAPRAAARHARAVLSVARSQFP